MQALLFFIALFTFGISFGQKKLTSVTNHYFDPNGQVYQKDSLAYHYGSWIGSLNQFKYEFKPDWDGVTDFQKSELRIACDSIESFYAYNTIAYSPYSVSYNSLNGDEILSTTLNLSTNTNSSTTNFTYNSSGNIQKIITDYFDLGVYNSTDSTWYNYDAMGNRINSFSSINSIPNLLIIDTTEYITGTNKIARFAQYSNSAIPGNAITKVLENFSHYIGSQIEYVDVWNTYAGPTCEWNFRKKYLFNSTGLNKTQIFPVSGGVLSSNPNSETLISYHSNGEPEVFTYLQNNGIMGKDSMEYDSDGFLSKIKNFQGNTLYLSKVERYRFQNTLSIPELVDNSILIFPNPTTNFIEIKTPEKLKIVEVYNTNGQLMIRQNMAKVDLSRLPNGTYIIVGHNDGGNFTKKVIKK